MQLGLNVLLITGILIDSQTAIVIPPGVSWVAHRALRSTRSAFYCGWVTSAIFGCTGLAAQGDWVFSGIAAANAIFAAYLWWRYRNKQRKRAPRAYGAKSRALIGKLIRKTRETAKPRPVLHPAPQGGF